MIRVNPPIHPGEILREEYLQPLGLAPYSLAKALKVPRTRVERLVRGETPVTPDTALRLGRYFGTTPEFWMNLQIAYDLTREERAKQEELSAIAPRAAACEPMMLLPVGHASEAEAEPAATKRPHPCAR